MFRVICLAKDIVSPVLDPHGSIVPIRALIARLVVYVHPHFGGGCDQYSRGDTGDRAWLESTEIVSYSRRGTQTRGRTQGAREARRCLAPTMFLVDQCIPLVATSPKHCYAMRQVRDAGPRRTLELPQLAIGRDHPKQIESQETAEERDCLSEDGTPHGGGNNRMGVGQCVWMNFVFPPRGFTLKLGG
jgi:hypothetical protein